MKLYLHFCDPHGYWLSSHSFSGTYFRTGQHSLFSSSPTWFARKDAATAAAVAMGFTVEDTTV